MSNKKSYFLSSNDCNRLRLEILNRVYNFFTINYFTYNKLINAKSALILECTAGFFAIELAKLMKNKGSILSIVLDANEELLQKACGNAESQGITNIEFRSCNIENMPNLNQKFDFIYGRWVLIFTYNIKKILAQLIEHLKPGGSLICEELNFEESGHFSYPHEEAVDKYHQFALNNCITGNLHTNLANSLYYEFKQHQLENITIKTNQPILTTADEKSVYRLGLITMSKAILNNQLCSEIELEKLINKFSEIEKNNIIIGCFRNLLIGGVKLL